MGNCLKSVSLVEGYFMLRGGIGIDMSYFDMVDLLQCFQVNISINLRLTWRNIYFLDRLFLIVLKDVWF